MCRAPLMGRILAGPTAADCGRTRRARTARARLTALGALSRFDTVDYGDVLGQLFRGRQTISYQRGVALTFLLDGKHFGIDTRQQGQGTIYPFGLATVAVRVIGRLGG